MKFINIGLLTAVFLCGSARADVGLGGDAISQYGTTPKAVQPDEIVRVSSVSYFMFESVIEDGTDLCVGIEYDGSKKINVYTQSGKKHSFTLYMPGATCGVLELLEVNNGCHTLTLQNNKLTCSLGASVRNLDADGVVPVPAELRIVETDTDKLKLEKIFASSAMNHCQAMSKPYVMTSFSALKLAKCFSETDSGTDLEMTCTTSNEFYCSKKLARFGTRINGLRRLRFIKQSGSYKFTGYGAAATVVVVLPGLNVDVSIQGHTEVYYLKDGNQVNCRDGEFERCTPM